MIRCCASITGASCSSKAKRRVAATFSWICRFSSSPLLKMPNRTAVKK